ncbi:hypothetical protein C7S16_0068 [Burkholderia thailandensis]|uniref:Uncharacterized protein n=1 Tax=Burkholderia thailandensis TaxID=57975 RepID=A0AAW9D3F7_BURTH|nr:hypothetical protein [Burkholderia thailandensis]MDW9255144.1 hypothetical protein [Burkholderia thailandensis]
MYAVGANAALAALPARRRRSCAASVQKKGATPRGHRANPAPSADESAVMSKKIRWYQAFPSRIAAGSAVR